MDLIEVKDVEVILPNDGLKGHALEKDAVLAHILIKEDAMRMCRLTDFGPLSTAVVRVEGDRHDVDIEVLAEHKLSVRLARAYGIPGLMVKIVSGARTERVPLKSITSYVVEKLTEAA